MKSLGPNGSEIQLIRYCMGGTGPEVLTETDKILSDNDIVKDNIFMFHYI